MPARRMIYGLLLAACFGGLAGCGGDNGTLPVETDEPLYREGQQLEKQGRTQEALVAYLKLISRRGDQAPESHLEAGVISLENIKDPIAAIYHFRRYLELEPNSHRAPLVRDQLDNAMRQFASSLPAQHWDSAKGLGGGSAEDLQRLESENTMLKAEIAAMRANAPAAITLHAAPAEESAPVPSAEASAPAVIPLAPDPVPIAIVRTAPPANSPARPSASPRAAVPVGPHSVRIHTVTAQDNLFSLSRRYYGNLTHWKDIRDANRDQLKGDKPKLTIGMQLKIP